MFACALRTHLLAAMALVAALVLVCVVAPMKVAQGAVAVTIAPADEDSTGSDRGQSILPPLDEEDALHETVERAPPIAALKVPMPAPPIAPLSFSPLPIRPPPEA